MFDVFKAECTRFLAKCYWNAMKAKLEYDGIEVSTSDIIKEVDFDENGKAFAKIILPIRKPYTTNEQLVETYWYFDNKDIRGAMKLIVSKRATLKGRFNAKLTKPNSNMIYIDHCWVVDCDTN